MRLISKFMTLIGALIIFSCQVSEKSENQVKNKSAQKVLVQKKQDPIEDRKDNLKSLNVDELLKEPETLLKKKQPMEYSNISKQHVFSDNGVRYEINLNWNIGNSISNDREHFFYRCEGEKTVIYDSWLQYGFMNGIYPCRPNCNTDLFAITLAENFPIEEKRLIVDSQNVCGEMRPLIWIEHDKIEPEPLFVTTMFVESNQEKFYKGINILEQPIPDWLNIDSIAIPKQSKNKKVKLYNYGKKKNSYIAEVTAEGWNKSKDEDKYGPSKEVNWQGIYYIEKDKILILTPIKYIQQQYYGEDFSLSGLEDINGDGVLDIIIGNPVSLVLESYKKGFRSWGFAFFPRGGC